ncbi:MAG TPA: formate dehydrogenase accessory protein FdhE [Chloroflexota bacterium]|nr:formate dehydrogenase accessory protein FdhE [Chloroflexota bacterium]
MEPAIAQLEDLARTDPTIRLLARLQAAVLRAAADPAWEQAVPPFVPARLPGGVPLLHEQTLRVDGARVADLLRHLAGLAAEEAAERVRPLRRALDARTLDPLACLQATVMQDTAQLEALAGQAEVAPALLATLAHMAALPLLQACGRQAAPLLEGVAWGRGYCPVCAAWPTLAELRGLERRRWLRCGRCGAGWTLPPQQCAFCGTSAHEALGYLAPEAQREARRAETCEQCRSFLKTLATLGPLAPAEVLLQDLTTVELDVAALEQRYGRPEAPGFRLVVRLEPAAPRNGWRRWWR